MDRDMFCSKCGKAINTTDKFCSHCGHSTQPHAAKSKKSLYIAIGALLVSVVATTPFAIDYFSHKADWREAQGSDSISAYQIYMRAWPNGSHHAQANQRIKEIQHDEDWAEASSQGTFEGFSKFLSKWPTTKKLENIENQTWEITEATGTMSAYQHFISLWTDRNSQYIEEAKDKLLILTMHRDWILAKADDEIESFETFISNWPNSEYVDKARERIAVIKSYENTEFEVDYITMPRPFTFNVPGKKRDRLAQIRMVLKVVPHKRKAIEKYIPLAEGTALKTLSRQTAEDLMQEDAFSSVKEQVLDELSSTGLLDGLKDVLFTGFVVQ